MANLPTNEPTRRRPDLGVMRTLMASDRTLMAWIRTGVSLLSFGFAIYKILHDLAEAGKAPELDTSPRVIGLYLAIMGTVATIMGTIEYWYTLRQLRQTDHFSMIRPSLITAVLMAIFGIILCLGMSTKLI